MSTDRIERETIIAAPMERVWAVVTEAQQIGAWFGDAGAEIDLRPGGLMILRWAEHGSHHARIERVEPPHFFSFRWARQADEEPREGHSTRVEFSLFPEGDTTRLRVVESGFNSLDVPEQERAKAAEGNTEGWIIELGHLQDYLKQLAR